jgi:hypothetical protein
MNRIGEMRISDFVFGVLRKEGVKAALMLISPVLNSGCMTTATVHDATHDRHIRHQVEIKRVEKVVLVRAAKLVLLLEGKMAGTSKIGPFTITARLLGSNDLSLLGGQAFGRSLLAPSAVTAGWHLPEGADLVPVDFVFPSALAGYGTAYDNRDTFSGIEGVARTVYVVTNPKLPSELQLVYVLKEAEGEEKIFFTLRPEIETRPPLYPLLLLVPLTVAGDLATLPLQIMFLWYVGR